MRKLLTALLLVGLILALVACGAADENAQQAPTTTASQTEPPTEAATESPTEKPHEHSYTESKVAPTCTEQGYALYSCSCGDSYKENPIPATGHTYTESKAAPTCTEDGGTVHTCACGDTYKSNVVSAVGHKWGSWTTVKEPTTAADGESQRKCSVCSETETKKLDKLIENHTHKYTEKVTTEATCTKEGVKTFTCSCGGSYTETIAKKSHEYSKSSTVTPTCTDSGYTIYKCKGCAAEDKRDIKSATGHTYNAATCTEPQTCKTCGTKNGKANGHSWKDATCTVAKTCSVCKATTGSAAGHTEVIDKAVAATCTTAGKTEGKHCSVCNTVIVKQETVAALGHNYAAATCDSPKTCTRCGATSGSAAGHKYNAATCTAPKTCSVCKKTEGSALGHTWTDATCQAPKTCKTCKTTTGSKASHKTSFSKTVAPTCGEQGYDLYKCANCDYTEKKNYTPVSGNHTMELVSNTATCTKAGVKTYKCKNCSKTTTESVPASGSHSMTTTTVAKAANKVNDLGNSALMKYRNMTDVNVAYCSKCGYVDYDSVASIYTAAQETAIMIDLMKQMRYDYIYGLSPDEDGKYMAETYAHISDKTSINHAIRRAKEISTDYSHNGAPANSAENISAGAQNWTEAYNGWKNSPEHYTNMIRWSFPYVGCSRYIVVDAEFETITIYYVAVFGYHSR